MGDCLNTSKLDYTTSAFEAIVSVDASERGRRNDKGDACHVATSGEARDTKNG